MANAIYFYIVLGISFFGEKLEKTFSAVLVREGNWFVSHCLEVGVSSQGHTKKSALNNLREAVELYLEEDPIGLPEEREVVKFKAKVMAYA